MGSATSVSSSDLYPFVVNCTLRKGASNLKDVADKREEKMKSVASKHLRRRENQEQLHLVSEFFFIGKET